jgi:dTDP-4-amino-4,6-dideoxygalactose transaminase
MINVTQTFLPPAGEYKCLIDRLWESKWLTNRGELVLDLEQKLQELLDVPNLVLMNNGTVPMQIALQLLAARGEVITTAFSYVATTSSIVWQGCTPVFVDIDPEYLTIDETKIEAAITSKTTAILATHVFGNPCNIEAITQIAKKHQLHVIYDAAHCFAVKYQGQSVFNYGDMSTCSFHATKIFHTAEGGALFTNDKNLMHKAFYSHDFGHNGQLDFFGVGINAKMNELQAAMGLAVLPHLETILSERKRVVEIYRKKIDTNVFQTLRIRENTEWNYSYFPVIFPTEAALLSTMKSFNAERIFPRRYFYPSLNTLNYVSSAAMPVSESIASRILCLPLYHSLTNEQVDRIVNVLMKSSKNFEGLLADEHLPAVL